ncbi:hypothetical protein BT69DRAFT_1341972 [Atractiella rhizophila]|nr:hypothetical protein BT69DRAFT_1341972 [Atractiella rhizophila]
MVRKKVDIPQEDIDKAMGHIPITDSDKKKAELQAMSIKKMMNRLMEEYKNQTFDQNVFDNLLIKYIVSTDQPFTTVTSPEFLELLLYLHWTVPISKNQEFPAPIDSTVEDEDTSLTSGDETMELSELLQLGCITGDERGIPFNAKERHMFCSPHIIHLAALELLKVIGAFPEKGKEDEGKESAVWQEEVTRKIKREGGELPFEDHS